MKYFVLVGFALVLAACSTPPANIVSSSSAGITIKSETVHAVIKDAALKRDQLMASTAQAHCNTMGKSAVQTMRENDGNYINATFECR